MNLNELFREVAAVAEAFDDAGQEVVGVETPGGQCTPEDPSLELTVDVSPADCADAPGGVSLVPRAAETTEDGRVRVTLAVEADESAPGGGAVTRGGGGSVVADGSDAGGGDEPSGASGPEDDESPDVPAYRDPAKLREVYDEDASFREMTAALDVDVTPQTVRRYMIDHGIHVPASARTDEHEDVDAEEEPGSDDEPLEAPDQDDDLGETAASSEATADAPVDDERGNGAGAESHVYEADGGSGVGELQPPVELPEGVTLADLREAVTTSRTVFEVQRALGTNREHTRELLDEFELLECVTGRLANAEEPPTPDQIEERIRMALSN